MKKTTLFLAVMTLALSLTACTAQAPTAPQETERDTVTASIPDSESGNSGSSETKPPAESERHSEPESHPESFPESERETAADRPETESETDHLTYEPDAPVYEGEYPSDRGWNVDSILTSEEFVSTIGKTPEEIAELFEAGRINRDGTTKVFPVAGGCIVDYAYSFSTPEYRFYDMATGKTAPLCTDPDCHAESCPLANAKKFLYSDSEYLYFTAPDPTQDQDRYARIYRCDLSRQSIEYLMDTDVVMHVVETEIETNEAGDVIGTSSSGGGYSYGFEHIYHAEGNLLYMTKLHYGEGETPKEEHRSYGIFDCTTLTFTPIEAAKGLNIYAVIDQDTVWCANSDAYDEGIFHFYKTDLNFSKVEPVPELEAFFEGPYSHVTKFTADYLLIEQYSMSNHRYIPDILYNPTTGRTVDYQEAFSEHDNVVFAGKYVYYTKPLSEEQIAASPLKEYFAYTFTAIHNTKPHKFSCLNMEAGRVYRTNLDTMEEELVLALSFDDVPVWIQDIQVNGGLCYITYSTYKDFRNLYNRKHAAVTDPSRQYFAIADFGSGTVRLIGK